MAQCVNDNVNAHFQVELNRIFKILCVLKRVDLIVSTTKHPE